MKNKTKDNLKNLSYAEAMLKLLSMSENSFKQGKYKSISKTFKDLEKRIKKFHQDRNGLKKDVHPIV